MNADTLNNTIYLLSAIAFILGLKLLCNSDSVRNGGLVIAVGLAAAVAVSLLDARIERLEYVLAGMGGGIFVGLQLARRGAAGGDLPTIVLLSGLGGATNLLVAWAEFVARPAGQGFFGGAVLALAVVFGGFSISGSVALWAMAKKGIASKVFFQKYALLAVAAAILVSGILFAADTVAPTASRYFAFLSLFSLILGIFWAWGLEDADTLAASCLLSACTGAAVGALGFVVQNTLLVAAGGLVAGSGIASALAVCKAASRPFSALLLGGFGKS